MTSVLRPQNVIHVKYIVTIFIIKAVILCTLARFREDSAGVSRRFVFEARIANAIGRRQMAREGLKRLQSKNQFTCHKTNLRDLRTLIKPPSGLALRKAGWALTLGRKSVIFRIFVNSGTGPLPGGPADCGAGRRGDLGSFPKTAFSWAVAEVG